jgi:hypothetical protein
MGKTITVNLRNKVTEEKVGCVVEVIHGNGSPHRVGLIADMDRVIKTTNYCWITKSIHPDNQQKMYNHILGLKTSRIDFQRMCDIVLTYIGYFDVVREYATQHKHESVGFLIRVYSDDESRTEIIPKSWDEIVEIAEEYLD